MERQSEQRPRPPVGTASFIFDPELAAPEPPPHLTAIPEGSLADRMRWLVAVESVFERALYVFIIAFGLCLAVLMFTQVVLRYVFASPFVGIEELSLLFGRLVLLPRRRLRHAQRRAHPWWHPHDGGCEPKRGARRSPGDDPARHRRMHRLRLLRESSTPCSRSTRAD